jgi:hypothetical protein
VYTIEAMPRKKANGPTVNFQLRLSGEEAIRYIDVLSRAKERNVRSDNTDVNRRLLKLDPDADGLVTDKEVAYFRGTITLGELGESEKKPILSETPPRKGVKKR